MKNDPPITNIDKWEKCYMGLVILEPFEKFDLFFMGINSASPTMVHHFKGQRDRLGNMEREGIVIHFYNELFGLETLLKQYGRY